MTFRNVGDEGNASSSRGRANSEPPRNQQGRFGFRNWEEDEVGRDLWKGLFRDEIPTPIPIGQVDANKNNHIGIGPSIGPEQVDAMGDSLMEAKEGFGLVDTEVGQVDVMGLRRGNVHLKAQIKRE
ncbi:hypothetical protein ACOSP7_016969 [Xanthoceras sorbifolium]